MNQHPFIELFSDRRRNLLAQSPALFIANVLGLPFDFVQPTDGVQRLFG